MIQKQEVPSGYVKITMENPFLMGKSTISMAIFNNTTMEKSPFIVTFPMNNGDFP